MILLMLAHGVEFLTAPAESPRLEPGESKIVLLQSFDSGKQILAIAESALKQVAGGSDSRPHALQGPPKFPFPLWQGTLRRPLGAYSTYSSGGTPHCRDYVRGS